MKEKIFSEIIQAILQFDEESLSKLTEAVINAKIDPVEVIEKSYTIGIQKVGELFGEGDYFLPELIRAAEIVKNAVTKIEKLMPQNRYNCR